MRQRGQSPESLQAFQFLFRIPAHARMSGRNCDIMPAPFAGPRRYLIDRFSAFTISPHLLTSDLNSASAWAGDPVIGSKPIVVSFF